MYGIFDGKVIPRKRLISSYRNKVVMTLSCHRFYVIIILNRPVVDPAREKVNRALAKNDMELF